MSRADEVTAAILGFRWEERGDGSTTFLVIDGSYHGAIVPLDGGGYIATRSPQGYGKKTDTVVAAKRLLLAAAGLEERLA